MQVSLDMRCGKAAIPLHFIVFSIKAANWLLYSWRLTATGTSSTASLSRHSAQLHLCSEPFCRMVELYLIPRYNLVLCSTNNLLFTSNTAQSTKFEGVAIHIGAVQGD